MNEAQYIEHEVQIRVIKEMSDAKFLATESKFTMMQKNFDDKFSHLDYKINLLIGIAVFALLVPIIKTALGIA